jgi:hypothetical protein
MPAWGYSSDHVYVTRLRAGAYAAVRSYKAKSRVNNSYFNCYMLN